MFAPIFEARKIADSTLIHYFYFHQIFLGSNADVGFCNEILPLFLR